MRDFNDYMESIIDPKRNPKKRSYEDDFDDDDAPRPDAPFFDDDDEEPTRNQLGLTAQYPLARSSGKGRGFQTITPDKMFSKSNVFKDKLKGRELVDTLRSKLYSGERMTPREINHLMKQLNQELAMLDSMK